MPDPSAPDTSSASRVRVALFWALVHVPVVGTALVAAGGPEAAWKRAIEHPLGALTAAIGFELLVFVLAIGKKVWAAVEPEVIKALADGVRMVAVAARARLLNLLSPFRRRYIKQVIYDHRNFNVRGLRSKGAYTLRLEQMFVDLRIAPKSAQQASLDPLNSGTPPVGNQPIWEFLRLAAIEKAVALAVVGPPGCGKTTLLQHVALTMALGQQRRHRVRPYVPLLLFLRTHTQAIIGDKSLTLGQLAQSIFSAKSGLPSPPPNWFEDRLRSGECIVLLDGLDEVADQDQRATVAKWVDQQISDYPESPFVLTARPLGYKTASLARAHVLEVQPFTSAQVQSFIRNWYLANEIMQMGGKSDAGVRQNAQEQAQDLLERLHARPALNALGCRSCFAAEFPGLREPCHAAFLRLGLAS